MVVWVLLSYVPLLFLLVKSNLQLDPMRMSQEFVLFQSTPIWLIAPLIITWFRWCIQSAVHVAAARAVGLKIVLWYVIGLPPYFRSPLRKNARVPWLPHAIVTASKDANLFQYSLIVAVIALSAMSIGILGIGIEFYAKSNKLGLELAVLGKLIGQSAFVGYFEIFAMTTILPSCHASNRNYSIKDHFFLQQNQRLAWMLDVAELELEEVHICAQDNTLISPDYPGLLDYVKGSLLFIDQNDEEYLIQRRTSYYDYRSVNRIPYDWVDSFADYAFAEHMFGIRHDLANDSMKHLWQTTPQYPQSLAKAARAKANGDHVRARVYASEHVKSLELVDSPLNRAIADRVKSLFELP